MLLAVGMLDLEMEGRNLEVRSKARRTVIRQIPCTLSDHFGITRH